MHSFCCVSTPPDRAPATPLHLPPRPRPPLSRLTEVLNMPSSKEKIAYRSLSTSTSSNNDQNGRPIRRSATLESCCGFPDHLGIAGILHKWVNYGRGWRPRWFVLKDGVLSYYKIHGPNKIIVNEDTEKGSEVIGEVSIKRMSRNANSESRQRVPVGEIHLKVRIYLLF